MSEIEKEPDRERERMCVAGVCVREREEKRIRRDYEPRLRLP